jgi:hypothetical protein
MMPLFFQAVRGDSPSVVGIRLIIPAFATPIGGVIAGSLMHRGYRLSNNVRMGTSLMFLGNMLAASMGNEPAGWKDFLYLIPANLGVGLTNPSVLFSFISFFGHRGKIPGKNLSNSDTYLGKKTEQAVATSTVYLIRSMGTIYGVTLTSTVVQNVLATRLREKLGEQATDEVSYPTRKKMIFPLYMMSSSLTTLIR